MLSEHPVIAMVPVSDLERSGKFYGDMLGLPEVSRTEDEDRSYECGAGSTLVIFRTRGDTSAGHTECGWQVDDIEGVVADLRQAGVHMDEVDLGDGLATVDGILTIGNERCAWFKDPDGNSLAVVEVTGR